MCLYAENETNQTKRLRRTAGVLAACAGTLAALPALGMTTGHHALAWTVIGLQICLISASARLLAKAKLQSSRSSL